MTISFSYQLFKINSNRYNMKTFQFMRRKRQLLSEEETLSIVHQGTSGVLALLDESGYPYAVPISYAYTDGKFYFHSSISGHKIDAIRHYPNASFCIIGKDDVKPAEYTTYFRSVIAFGQIHIVENEDEKLAALRLLGKRYNPNEEKGLLEEINKNIKHVHVIRFSVEHMTGKESIELVKLKNKTN